MRPTGPTNELLEDTVALLRSKSRERAAWGRVAELLSRPARRRPEVNLSKINRYANDGDVVLVPGKVLGTGKLTKRVTVAAFTFSKGAIAKIEEAGGRPLALRDAVNEVKEFKNVKIVV